MRIVTDYPDDNYPVIVEHDIQLLDEIGHYTHYIYIIDQALAQPYETKIAAWLHPQAITFYVSAGESLKTFERFSELTEQILAHNITRKSVVIAIGGGTVGDFAGFIAASVLRGIDFIQVPTTILAHDSAIGGKVGINSVHGKNLIGAFKRPTGVYYDLDFLKSLPQEERLSGFGEIVKHAMIQGHSKLEQLMTDFNDPTDLMDTSKLEYWLVDGMKLKLSIVKADEFESGVRKFLNLGHTFGHAVEFIHKIPHGHAVMIGLIYTRLLSGMPVNEFKVWIEQLGLEFPKFKSFDVYLDLMKKDKKNTDDIQFVLLDPAPFVTAVTTTQLSAAFSQLTGGKDGN